MTEVTETVSRLPRWYPIEDAARALGLSPRTLRRKANEGTIKRKREDGRALYLIQPPETDTRPDTGRTPRPDGQRTSGHTSSDAATLRALLDEANHGWREAERRAAVAEYRAELAEVDPDEYRATIEALATVRSELEQTRRERDEAHADGLRLAEAMRKRYAVIQRLTRRLRDAGA